MPCDRPRRPPHDAQDLRCNRPMTPCPMTPVPCYRPMLPPHDGQDMRGDSLVLVALTLATLAYFTTFDAPLKRAEFDSQA